jgi:predicted dehydrogenase
MLRLHGARILKSQVRLARWVTLERMLLTLAEFITGLKITHLCADLNAMVPGRALDDDGNVLLKFDNGAAGVLMASQVAAGEENALRFESMGRTVVLSGRSKNPIHFW